MSVCSREWFAVYTKPRQEQVALLNLEGQDFDCFLPMTEEPDRRRGSLNSMRSIPLFPRYLFLSAAPEMQSLATVRSTRGVVGLVKAGFELSKIPASIIAEIKARVHPETGMVSLDSLSLKTGDRVRVSSGPFSTLQGVFKEHRGQFRSLLLLDILGRHTAVQIDARFLQRLD